MRVTVLGSGASTGVPIPACPCAVCASEDPRDKRLRSSILIEVPNPDHQSPRPYCSIVVDTSPDFRQQVLAAGVRWIDGVFFTHGHSDHIAGLDELRSFNFLMRRSIPVFADLETLSELRKRFFYAFDRPRKIPGAPATPLFDVTEIHEYEPVKFCGVEFLPLRASHGDIPVLGYRIGKFAYLTDCGVIPERTRELLQGLDLLILGALRPLSVAPRHLGIPDAVAEIQKIQPKRAIFTHLCHEVSHAAVSRTMRELLSIDVDLACDGMVFEVP